MAEKKTAQQTEAPSAEPKFSKAQLCASKKYANRRDALWAVLDDSKEYTIAEADKALDNFMKMKG